MTAAQQEALTTQPTQLTVVDSWQSVEALKARIQQIQRLMNDVLKKDVDYGIIPGMPKDTKPSLRKSGSEQILAMFRIAVEPLVEDLSTEDCYRYRVTTRLTDVRTEAFLGAGLGECSTNETKYKWKRTYSEKEFNAAPADRKKIQFKRYKDDHGTWIDAEDMMIRQEPADMANTALKIAKKRSQVDGTLTVTGASSMFSQDLDDEFGEDAESTSQQQPQGKRRGRPAQAKQEDVKCGSCGAVNGHLPSCKYHPSQKETKPAATETKAAKTETKPVEGEVVADRLVCQIKAFVDAKTQGGAAYVKYEVVDTKNRESVIYCFHKTANEELKAKAVGAVCLLRYSVQRRQENEYIVVEEILEIGGVQYRDGKPVDGQMKKQEEPW